MSVRNIITVDLEEWFHVCGLEDRFPQARWPALEARVIESTERLLRIFSHSGVRATFFVLGAIAEQHPDLIGHIRDEGHEIASHGYAHQRVYDMTPAHFRDDLRKASGLLSAITKKPVKGYRAPEWSIRDDSLWALDILIEEGFLYDASMTPLPIIGNPRYSRLPVRLQRAQGALWEFPPLVAATPFVNLPLGGSWGLRVFPYRMLRNAIRNMNAREQPALIYLHPRELDPACPRVKLPLYRSMALYAGTRAVEGKLLRLLDEFTFTAAEDILAQYQAEGAGLSDQSA